MRNAILILLLGAALASCNRSHTCTCVRQHPTDSTQTIRESYEISGTSHSKAAMQCKDVTSLSFGTGGSTVTNTATCALE